MVDGDRALESESHPLRLALGNLALIATVAAFLTVAMRALAVARLDPNTAVGLVRSSGPVNVFVGTLTAELPALVISAFTMFWVWNVYLAERARPAAAAIGVTILIVGFVGPVRMLAFLFVLIVALFPRQWTRRRQYVPSQWWRGFQIFMLVLLGVGLSNALLFSEDVWLPQERLDLAQGGHIYGYVLEEDGPWVTILREDERELVLVQRADVVGRAVCDSFGGQDEVSMAQYVNELWGEEPQRPSYELCS